MIFVPTEAHEGGFRRQSATRGLDSPFDTPGGPYRHFVRSSQKATALAAATLRESTSWSMGMRTV